MYSWAFRLEIFEVGPEATTDVLSVLFADLLFVAEVLVADQSDDSDDRDDD